MQARINSILRENELLKHQLKKYVGAVQKLRDGPQAHETLAQLEGKLLLELLYTVELGNKELFGHPKIFP